MLSIGYGRAAIPQVWVRLLETFDDGGGQAESSGGGHQNGELLFGELDCR